MRSFGRDDPFVAEGVVCLVGAGVIACAVQSGMPSFGLNAVVTEDTTPVFVGTSLLRFCS